MVSIAAAYFRGLRHPYRDVVYLLFLNRILLDITLLDALEYSCIVRGERSLYTIFALYYLEVPSTQPKSWNGACINLSYIPDLRAKSTYSVGGVE